METHFERLHIFAQLTEGHTLSNYLDIYAKYPLKIIDAYGLVNKFRTLYTYESYFKTWVFINNTMEDVFDALKVNFSSPVTQEYIDLLNSAITGISSMAVTYGHDLYQVGIIRVDITRWQQHIINLTGQQSNNLTVLENSARDIGTGASYAVSSSSYSSGNVVAHVVGPVVSPVVNPIVDSPVSDIVDVLTVDNNTLLDVNEDTNSVQSVAVDITTAQPPIVVIDVPTPVLDELNMSINAIAAQSQVKTSVISRAEKRWLEQQRH